MHTMQSIKTYTQGYVAGLVNLKNKNRTIRAGPIGLHFSLEKLHMVQLLHDNDENIELGAYVSKRYPRKISYPLVANRELCSFIKQSVSSTPFRDREVISVLPSQLTRVISVTYTVTSEKSEEKAIAKILKERLAEDLSNYVIDYLPVRTDASVNERLAIVAVARQNDVVNYLELLRKSSLRIRALEIGPVAIKRLIWALSGNKKDHCSLVINFGYEKSYLTMISGRRLLFDRAIEFGQKFLLQKICRTLEMSEELVLKLINNHGIDPGTSGALHWGNEANSEVAEVMIDVIKPQFLRLVDEIKNAFIYAASETHGQNISIVYLLGSIARWPGSDRFLNHLIDLPVTTPNPLSILSSDIGQAGEHCNSELAIAVGLALRGMPGYV